MTQAECEALGGVFQGAGVSCEAGDCGGTCCLAQSGECSPVYLYVNCATGYFASRCESIGGTTDCDASVSQGLTGDPTCSGLPTQVTVEVTGAVLAAGANADYQALVDACNAAFAVDIASCTSAGSHTEYVSVVVNGTAETWRISVSVAFNGGGAGRSSATLTVASAASGYVNGSGVNVQTANDFLPAVTACDGSTTFRDCSTYGVTGYTGSTNVFSPVDLDSATVDLT